MARKPFDPAAHVRISAEAGESVYLSLGHDGIYLSRSIRGAKPYTPEYCEAIREACEPDNQRTLANYLIRQPGVRPELLKLWRALRCQKAERARKARLAR